jgi:hypothetical protein
MEGHKPVHQFVDSPKPQRSARRICGMASRIDANDHGNQQGGNPQGFSLLMSPLKSWHVELDAAYIPIEIIELL